MKNQDANDARLGMEHGQDEMLSDLPDAASEWERRPPFDPDDAVLREADQEEQKEQMRLWFYDRYCDPAEETPYETAEGGYIWIWGGPYYADQALQERFVGVVPDEVIDAVTEEIGADGIYQWAPIRRDEDFDDRFDLELDAPNEPLIKLRARLAQALSTLSLQGDPAATAQLPSMAFGAVISALEAYLWETFVFWTKTDPQVLKRIVTKLPDLKDIPLKLGQIFDLHDAIEARVLTYLQNLVWHRWEKVALLMKFGLDIKPPSFKPFEDALVKRHDIVHRSGHDREGNPVSVSEDDARELAAAVDKFAVNVTDAILAKVKPSMELALRFDS